MSTSFAPPSSELATLMFPVATSGLELCEPPCDGSDDVSRKARRLSQSGHL
jgi:hypothetical protein